jgi:hypothetical protein
MIDQVVDVLDTVENPDLVLRGYRDSRRYEATDASDI